MTSSSRRRLGTSRTWPPSRSSMTTSPPPTQRCVPFSTSTSPTFASTRGMSLIRSPPGCRRRRIILGRSGTPRGEVSRSGEQEQRWQGSGSRREDQHRDVPGAPVRAEEPGRVQGPREARAPARPAGEGETGPGGRAGPAGPRSRQCRQTCPARRLVVADRLAEAGRAADRHARRLAETADRSGISRDGSPADTGEDLPVTAKARAAARRDDIREVRDHLAHVRDAERDRVGAEASLGTARQLMETCETSCREADDRLAAARADLSGKLAAWAGRWTGDEPYAAVTAEPGRTAPGRRWTGSANRTRRAWPRLFGTLTAERGHALTAQRPSALRTRDADLADAAARLAEERETVAGERDDGPPASDLRPAHRAERAGAPLWQLADFRPRGGRRHRRRDRRRAVRGRPAHRLGSSRSRR